MLRSTQVCVSGAQKVHLSKEKVFRSVSNKVPICLRTQEGDDTPWSDDLTSQRWPAETPVPFKRRIVGSRMSTSVPNQKFAYKAFLMRAVSSQPR